MDAAAGEMESYRETGTAWTVALDTVGLALPCLGPVVG